VVLGFPLAVVYKYFDDQGPYLAATLTYYAFVSIFPLMLLGSSILGLVLRGEPGWQESILDSALAQFPIIGDQLGRPEGLRGSVWGVTVGALAALYGCQGLGQALQNTQHVAWSVPRNSRPNPVFARVKTVGLLLVAGLSLLTVSVLSTLLSSTDVFTEGLSQWQRLAVMVVTILIVGAFFTVLFRLSATGPNSRFRRVAPGAFTLAAMFQLLQVGGAVYVQHVLVGASSMAKTFGLVLGLVALLFVGAVMAVLSIEVNVVITRRLYPRALLTPFTDAVSLTEADRRAYALYARMQRHKGFQRVNVEFDEPYADGEAPEGPPDEDLPDGELPDGGLPDDVPEVGRGR
ncbi:MAG: YihY/virulence factor BrkB family protein, partial [Nocardioides sp.]|uniref:YihY/virulence factor BrkB family protein n=1 Tax=Nocardioides sp. TaxID=35761 RepID=UPI003F0258A2